MAVNESRTRPAKLEPSVKLIVGGGVVSLVGIVLAAAGNNTLGGAVTLAGWLGLVYGIHRFGRSGAD